MLHGMQMWRTVLKWIALPGFLLGAAMLLTVPETRKPPAAAPPAQAPSDSSSSTTTTSSLSGSVSGTMDAWERSTTLRSSAALTLPATDGVAGGSSGSSSSAATVAATAAAIATVEAGGTKDVIPADTAGWAGVSQLLRSQAFMSVTLAAALNDVASYALVAWQVGGGAAPVRLRRALRLAWGCVHVRMQVFADAFAERCVQAPR